MVQLLRQRNADRAFERLYLAHAGDVYRYSLALTGNPADAEDVAQTTFMNAYRALDAGEHPIQPRNWLIAIAHNVCRQRFRQASRRPAEVLLDEDFVEAVVPDERSPTAADIQRALMQLPVTQRETLVMRELEGRSYADIAAALGLSVTAVESALFRARRALREQMETSLTCEDAEAAISLQMDGRLAWSERGALRGHLRACAACRGLAKRQRAQRKGWKAFAMLPLPPSFGSLMGTSSAGFGTAAALKVAAVTTAVVVGGGTYAVVQHEAHHATPRFLPAVRPSDAQRPGTGLGRRTTTPVGRAKHSKKQPAHHRVVPVTVSGGANADGGSVAATHGEGNRSVHSAAHAVRPVHPARPVHPVRPTHPAHPTGPPAEAKGAAKPKQSHKLTVTARGVPASRAAPQAVEAVVPTSADAQPSSHGSSHAERDTAHPAHP